MIGNYQVAMGVKVFKRTEKLEQLLRSAEDTVIDAVYVADDGETEHRTELYEREYSFELHILNLAYDAGLGFGRKRIVETVDEEYLLIVDSDHTIPHNVAQLGKQLAVRPEIGGVSGLLLEEGNLRGLCHDLWVEDNVLIRGLKDRTRVTEVAGYPFVRFDFIPNAAMFRVDCLRDYCWDPQYQIEKEHLDFYVGHLKQTEWEFGTCPEVLFGHHPYGNTEYISNRGSPEKAFESKQYFDQKWNFRQIIMRDSWLGMTDRSLPNRVPMDLPLPVEVYLLDLNDIIVRMKSRLKKEPSFI